MLGCTETITAVMRYYDPETRADSYRCRVLQGASWYARSRCATAGNGLQAARLYQVRLPRENAGGYCPPCEYDPDASESWTLRPGDKLARGALPSCTGEEFAALARTREAFTVLDVHDNLSRPANPHLYIEGA